MAPRFARRIPLIALMLVVSATACVRQLVSVLLDLPDPRPRSEQPAALQTASDSSAAADSTRPPIEQEYDAVVVQTMLPRDSGGNIDWVRALRDSIIRPRFTPDGARAVLIDSGFNYDVFLTDDSLNTAVFSHTVHLEWSTCQSCHPQRFPKKHEPITHAAMQKGQYCGACHGTVAFPMRSACYRCHRDPPQTPTIEANGELLGDVTLTRYLHGRVLPDTLKRMTFPPSRFSHWTHRIRYRCSTCHTRLFEERAGSTRTSMEEIAEGKTCGACHDGKIAFGTGIQSCGRCHLSVAR